MANWFKNNNWATGGLIGTAIGNTLLPGLGFLPGAAIGSGIGMLKDWREGRGNPITGFVGSSGNNGLTSDTSAWENMSSAMDAEREWNAAEAQKDRDWQEYMSNTAVQRATADIKAAGLNPWLAVQGSSALSASTPSGAQASSSNTSALSAALQYNQSMVSTLVNAITRLASSALKLIK